MRSTWRLDLLPLLVLGLVVVCAARNLLLEPDLLMQPPGALVELMGIEQLQRLLTGQQGWDEAWLGWPVGPGWVQQDWQLMPALLAWPLGALGIGPEGQLAVLAVAGMMLTAWACHLAARALLGAGTHTWVAGAVGGLAPLLLGVGTPLVLVHGELSVGGALLVGLGLSRRRPLLAFLGGLALASSAHMGWQQGAHAVLLGALALTWAVWRRAGDAHGILAGSAGLLLGLTGVGLVGLPTLRHAAAHQASWSPQTPTIGWAVPVVMLLGLTAALGARWMAERLPSSWRPFPAVSVMILLALPSWGRTDQAAPGIPEVYVGLEAAPPGPLYERFTSMHARCVCDGTPHLAAALLHERPIAGGRWAWDDPGIRSFEAMAGRFPEAQAAELLRTLGVAMVIEHTPVTGPPPAGASCQRVHDHRLCALEPTHPAGLPQPHQVETLGHGPVVGLRWTTAPSSKRLELRCEARPPWRTSTEAWQVLAQLRDGPEPPWVDIYLPEPCPTVPEASEGSPLPLYAVNATESP